jgi:hypothetical protein
MSTRAYWQSQSVIVDWTLVDPTTGAFVTGATVAGTVTLPGGTTSAMTITPMPDRYRATYDPQVSGTFAYRLVATGAADSAEEGTFVVRRAQVGLPPITLDPASNVGMVRLLITDTDETSPLFEDAQIAAFLAVEAGKAGQVKLAAATGLEIIARSEALVSKKLTTSDGLTTDGPALADALLRSARALRDQVAQELQDGNRALLPIYSFPSPVPWGDAYL